MLHPDISAYKSKDIPETNFWKLKRALLKAKVENLPTAREIKRNIGTQKKRLGYWGYLVKIAYDNGVLRKDLRTGNVVWVK